VARLPGGEGASAPLDAALRLMRRRGLSAQSTKMAPEVLSRLLTVQELADLLQVPVKTIYTCVTRGWVRRQFRSAGTCGSGLTTSLSGSRSEPTPCVRT
jgi:hypothetical protein